MLEGKKIAIGVTGGIACYKVVTLVSRLVQAGAEVRVVMSEAATKLVSPLLFKEISGAPVAYDMWRGNDEFNVEHVALGRWCDLMVVAPATANIIGKMAGGIADDLLSTTLMACDKPKIICPAMNTNMLNNPAVVRNLETLRRDGILIMPSGAGYLACGINGAGRLPEPEDIKAYLDDFFAKRDGDLRGRRILVTAGGTREAIDPVRFISNHSTGRMGYAIAEVARDRGARVVLVSGPVSLEAPEGVELVSIVSAQDLFDVVSARYAEFDAVVAAAAVADYRPKTVADNKMKKKDGDLSIELERTPDTLSWLGAHRVAGQRLCGFSMETCNVLENSRGKLTRKNVDMICANSLREEGAGFGTATNHLTLISREHEVDLPMLSKADAADALLTELFSLDPLPASTEGK